MLLFNSLEASTASEGGIDVVISNKRLARAHVEKLKEGYSAFTESPEVARYIEKELDSLGFSVHIDRTPYGFWYIPLRDET